MRGENINIKYNMEKIKESNEEEIKSVKPPATPSEIEIRLRLTKEQVIYELQVLIAYSKIHSADDIAAIFKLLICTDLDEIAEERSALSKCNNPYCTKGITVPKIAPKYEIDILKGKLEKFAGKYYCSDTCKSEYKKLQNQLQENVQSHQLADVELYYSLCEKCKAVSPRLESLKEQMMKLSAEYRKSVAPTNKA